MNRRELELKLKEYAEAGGTITHCPMGPSPGFIPEYAGLGLFSSHRQDSLYKTKEQEVEDELSKRFLDLWEEKYKDKESLIAQKRGKNE